MYDDKENISLTYKIIDIIPYNNYLLMSTSKGLNFVKMMYKGKLLYFLVQKDIPEMGKNVKCLICNSENSFLGLIIIGNKMILGSLICIACKSLLICEFNERSKEEIIQVFNLKDEMINEDWNTIEEATIH